VPISAFCDLFGLAKRLVISGAELFFRPSAGHQRRWIMFSAKRLAISGPE